MKSKRHIEFGLLPIYLILQLVFGCHGTKPPVPDALEDFGLGTGDTASRTGAEQYYSDLERSTSAVPFRSSFPLAFSVAGTRSKFESPPIQAMTPLPSRLTIRLGECSLFLRTGPIQVRRFLFTGEWVKFGEEFQAQSVVKLEKNMDLNLKMASQLQIEIPQRHFDQCRRVLYGRRTFIGRYHMQLSDISLLEDSSSRASRFDRADVNQEGQKVYIYWHKYWKVPVLKNELEFPATVESAMYRAQLGESGFYYIGFQPVLRMQNVDRLVIQIPLPEQLKQLQQRKRQPKNQQSKPQSPLLNVQDSKS
ncbi:MAG: hypothetical protein ACOH5I_15475 [Oligoflexus sp.]